MTDQQPTFTDAPLPAPPSGRTYFPSIRATSTPAAPAPAFSDAPLDPGVVKGVVDTLDPIPMMKGLIDAYKAAPLGTDPLPFVLETVGKGLAGAHLDQIKKAKQAFDEGRYSEMVGHTAAALLPIVGPMAAKAGEDIGSGKPQYGVGEALGTLLPFGLKYATEALHAGTVLPTPDAVAAAPAPEPIQLTRPRENANPLDRAAVAFGKASDIPIDAGTATGSQFVKNLQKRVGSTWAGAPIAEAAQRGQAEALARVGDQLATDVNQGPAVTPELAGTSTRGAVEKYIGDVHRQASDAYDRLREFEADPQFAERIPTAPAGSNAARSIVGKIGAGMDDGKAPTIAELKELHRMRAEMDSVPFTKRTWNDAPDKRGNAGGGSYDLAPGSAGAPVYTDILSATKPDGTPFVGSDMTRSEVAKAISKMIETGQVTNAGQAALDVARARLAGSSAVNRPILPPSAGDVAHPVGALKRMLLPVDIAPAKKALSPIYEQLKREAELVPLQGGKAHALVALDRLLNGPDHAPVSVVDAALGDLKSMARGASLTSLRTDAQGLAAAAVKRLDAVVRQAVQRAGPEAVSALEEGRSATVAKYSAAAVLDQLHDEPVKTFKLLTTPKDANIQQLRAVQELAPAEMPRIGRAWVEDWLGRSTAEGGFNRADARWAEWRKLGDATKSVLFTPDQIKNFDRFALLAKRIGENPNPSGTAQVLNATQLLAVIPAWGITKILYSPFGVEKLTRGLTLARSAGTSRAAMAAAISEITAAAKVADVPLALPKAGEDRRTSPATTGRR